MTTYRNLYMRRDGSTWWGTARFTRRSANAARDAMCSHDESARRIAIAVVSK
jgi:hypothetical protein